MVRKLIGALLLIVIGFAAGLALTARGGGSDERLASLPGLSQPAPPAAVAVPGVAQTSALPAGALPDFTGVAERTVNAVTNISAVQVIRRPMSPFANDPFFRYFFGDDPDLFGGVDRREASLGSGVVVSDDGYVLTNNHVISGVSEVVVALADKRELAGRVVGTDDWTDIALVKLDATGLPTVPWGDSSRLKVADWVLAIGNPFQLSQTVTLGIISAVGRTNVGIAAYEDFIQTDAAINPGNSGGALINARGELVGINTAIFSQSGGYQGIGFAVPSNLARRVMNDLIQYGEVRRGSIGFVEVMPLTPRLVRTLGVPSGSRGAVISRMRRDSPAYRAGLRPGDLIVGFNGEAIDDPGHFLRLVSDAPIGSRARIDILRGADEIDVEVSITQAGQRPR